MSAALFVTFGGKSEDVSPRKEPPPGQVGESGYEGDHGYSWKVVGARFSTYGDTAGKSSYGSADNPDAQV
jgi:hypothetical protein